MKGKLLALLIVLLIIFTFSLFVSGCKDKPLEEETIKETQIQDDDIKEAESDATDTKDKKEDQDITEESKQSGIEEPTTGQETEIEETEEEVSASGESTEEVTQEEEEIPEDIQSIIDTADSLYIDGEYALAEKEYRKAQIAIEDSDLTQDTKDVLLADVNNKYSECKDIVETARMHYANSMQLQYEKRFEEAKLELEAALEIYPKYTEAIDAYETLKAIMGLS